MKNKLKLIYTDLKQKLFIGMIKLNPYIVMLNDLAVKFGYLVIGSN